MCDLLSNDKEIFTTELGEEPARIPPMELNVDTRAWDALKANKGPPRQMSMQKQQELLRQVNMMLQQKVIATANAESYSHVLLTPKPNGKWRFCVDFVK